MYKQYIKQAVQMLRENTLVSIISISGTALAIACDRHGVGDGIGVPD